MTLVSVALLTSITNQNEASSAESSVMPDLMLTNTEVGRMPGLMEGQSRHRLDIRNRNQGERANHLRSGVAMTHSARFEDTGPLSDVFTVFLRLRSRLHHKFHLSVL
jgi:hypothetical protein